MTTRFAAAVLSDIGIDMSTNEDNRSPLDDDASFTTKLDVPRTYYPLRPVVSRLWQTSLQTMRGCFVEAARNQGRLTCVLTESIVPEWPKRPAGPNPPGIAGLEQVAFGSGPRREPQQRFTKRENGVQTVVSGFGSLLQQDHRLTVLDKSTPVQHDGAEYEALVGDRPVFDVNGKPIVFSDDKPVAMQLGASRQYIAYAGGSALDRATVCESFYSTAAEAGQCLYGLPVNVNRILWRDWLDGFGTINASDLWINALFELAWQHFPGTSLVAEQLAWNGPVSIPLDALPYVRRQAEHRTKKNVTNPDIPDPPAHWYSVLDNLLSASVAAIDMLLEIGDKSGGGQRVSHKQADPGKRDISETSQREDQVESTSTEEVPALSHRCFLLLRTLLVMKATAADVRQTTAKIVEKAEGKHADPVSFKKDIASLKADGFIDTKGGRGGGRIWSLRIQTNNHTGSVNQHLVNKIDIDVGPHSVIFKKVDN